MIRVVLDTNVIVSSLLAPAGPPAKILLRALRGSDQLCLSGAVYKEYEQVIRRPRFRLPEVLIAATLRALRESSLWMEPTETVDARSDPDDNIFLECAQASRAEYLVTVTGPTFPLFGSKLKSSRHEAFCGYSLTE